MAGGKETPRQKMIGMMYLVLTALLALNVSKEILDAFVLMDEGLRKTEATLTAKNNDTMAAFASKMAANPAKTKPFKDAADQIVSETDKLVDYIEELKARTMSVSHNANSINYGDPGFQDYMDADGHAVALDAVNADGDALIKSKDENQENTALLVGSKPEDPKSDQWSARELKDKLIAYGEFLKNIKFKEVTGKEWKVPDNLIKSIDQTFTYPDVQEAEKTVAWETKNFFHNPLAAIIPVMTKLQVDVENAEADMLATLLGGIEGKSYKFTNLVPLVVPQSSYILQGDTFRADVLLAAYDGTNPPKIYVDQTSWNGADSSAIEVSEDMLLEIGPNGLGSLKIPSNKVGLGEHMFKGKIIYDGPSGAEEYPLYVPPVTVSSPALVVSPTKMNVFYRGLPNPVEISVPGVPADKIRPSISGGHTLTKDQNGWVVKPGKSKDAVITVTAEMPDGSTQNMGKKEFRVKRIPDPVPKFAGKYPTDNTVPKGDLTVAAGIRAEMQNFDFEVDVRVQSFNMIFIRDGAVIEKKSNSNRVTEEMKSNIKKVGKGQKVYVEKIMVKMPDGTTRQVANISLKVV